jgi:hypothetical protein
MTVEQVKVNIVADGSKVGTEVSKLKRDMGGLSDAADKIGLSWAKLGGIIGGALSVGAAASFLRSVNSSADALNDLSGRLGASAAGLQSLQVAATLAGGSTESMNTALAKMSETIGNALNGNKQAVAAFDQLGLSAKELANLKADEAFRRIADATAEIPNTFQRASAAQDVFGRGAKEIAGLLAEGGAAIDSVNRKLAEQGAAIDNLDIARIGVMNDELQFQQTVVQNLGTKFLSGLAPAIGVATDAFAKMLSAAGGATESGRAFGVVMTGAIKLIESAVYGLAAVFEGLRATVAVVLAAISNAAGNVIGVVASAGEALGLGFAGNLRTASDSAFAFGESFASIAASAKSNAMAAASAAIQAGADILNAGLIFDQQAAALEKRAQAAVDRVSQAQGGAAAALGGAASGAAGKDAKGAKQRPYELSAGTLFMEKLNPFDDPRVMQELEINDALQAIQDQYAETTLGKLAAFEDTKLGMMLTSSSLMQQIEWNKNATLGDAMTNLVGLAAQQSGALGKIGKAFAVAQTIWSTGSAIMKVFQQLGWPAGIGPAASIAAMGASQLANIKNTNLGSGGTIAPSRGGGATLGAPVLSDNVAATRPQESERSATQVIIQGNVFSSQETAQWIIEQIRDAVNTRDAVFISSNSRQALELAGA